MSAIKRKNKWWVDFSYQGQRHRLVSPENSRSGAKSYESVLRNRLANGQELTPPEKKKFMTLKEFANKWLEAYVKVNNKPSEIKNKTTYLRSCLLPAFGNKRLDEITSLDIEEFKAKQLKRLMPKTINNQLGTLAKCLKTAIEWGELEKMPIIRPLRSDPAEFDYLNEEEAKRLLDASDGFYYTAILIALHTGVRLGELMALKWVNVDFRNRQIIIKDNFSAGVLGSTKSNKIRYMPMTSDLYDHLISLEPKEDFVLKGPDGKRFRPECSRTTIHQICDKAKLRHVGWHRLRHTFASRLAEKGITMATIKELMGHSDIRTTMRYAHLGQHTLKDAIKVLESSHRIELRHNSVTPANLGVTNSGYQKQENTR